MSECGGRGCIQVMMGLPRGSLRVLMDIVLTMTMAVTWPINCTIFANLFLAHDLFFSRILY